MRDEEDLLTCEDTCDDWFEEEPAEASETHLISDASHRCPDALALKVGGEPGEANRRLGP